MAEATEAKVTETRADMLPKADAPKAPAAQPAKAEAAKAAVVKAEPAPAPAPAPVAKAATPKARKPARRAAKKTIKQAKPARKPAAARTVRKAKPARAGAATIKTGVKTMANKTNETGKIAAEQFNAVLGDVNARAKTAFEKSAKIVEEIADLTRGNVEAIVASSKVAAKGVETLGQGAAEYGRKSFEDASAALKRFAEVKSATDFFRLQGDYARGAFDAAVAESARMSETVMKLAGDLAEPLNSRYAAAAERVKTLAA